MVSPSDRPTGRPAARMAGTGELVLACSWMRAVLRGRNSCCSYQSFALRGWGPCHVAKAAHAVVRWPCGINEARSSAQRRLETSARLSRLQSGGIKPNRQSHTIVNGRRIVTVPSPRLASPFHLPHAFVYRRQNLGTRTRFPPDHACLLVLPPRRPHVRPATPQRLRQRVRVLECAARALPRARVHGVGRVPQQQQPAPGAGPAGQREAVVQRALEDGALGRGFHNGDGGRPAEGLGAGRAGKRQRGRDGGSEGGSRLYTMVFRWHC